MYINKKDLKFISHNDFMDEEGRLAALKTECAEVRAKIEALERTVDGYEKSINDGARREDELCGHFMASVEKLCDEHRVDLDRILVDKLGTYYKMLPGKVPDKKAVFAAHSKEWVARYVKRLIVNNSARLSRYAERLTGRKTGFARAADELLDHFREGEDDPFYTEKLIFDVGRSVVEKLPAAARDGPTQLLEEIGTNYKQYWDGSVKQEKAIKELRALENMKRTIVGEVKRLEAQKKEREHMDELTSYYRWLLPDAVAAPAMLLRHLVNKSQKELSVVETHISAAEQALSEINSELRDKSYWAHGLLEGSAKLLNGDYKLKRELGLKEMPDLSMPDGMRQFRNVIFGNAGADSYVLHTRLAGCGIDIVVDELPTFLNAVSKLCEKPVTLRYRELVGKKSTLEGWLKKDKERYGALSGFVERYRPR